MKKILTIIVIIIASLAITLPDNFIQIEDSDYVRYVNSIRCDVDPYGENSIGIYVNIDSLGYEDALVLIVEDDSIYYADTVFKRIVWDSIND